MKPCIRFLFIILLSLGQSLTAQQLLPVKESDQDVDLNGALLCYRDKGQAGIKELLLSDTLFQPINPDRLQFSYSGDHVWLKLPFQYKGSTPAELYFVSRFPSTNHVSFYQIDEQHTILREVNTGIDYPFSSREMNTRSFVFKVPVQPGKTYTLYLLLHNRLGSLSAAVKLMNAEGYMRFSSEDTLYTVSFITLLLITFLISLVLAFFFREKIYFYYSSYLFSLSLIMICSEGFAFQYVWPNAPWMAVLSKGIFVIPCIAFFQLFFFELVKHPSFPPEWLKKLIAGQNIIYLLLLISVAIPKPDNITKITVLLMNLNLGLSLVLIIGATIKSLFDRYRPVYFFAAGLLPVTILCFSVLLRNFGFLPTNSPLVHYNFQIGSTIEIAFLFAALLSRFRNNERQNRLLKDQILYYKSLIEGIVKNNTILPEAITDKKQKQSTTRFTEMEIELNHLLLRELMQTQKIYLDKDISLYALATAMTISPHLLSYIINEKEQKNFTEYINFYRIEEAKKMLSDPAFDHYSIEGIGQECGFSTRTTFYSAFRKNTGMTPVSYKKGETIA